MRLGGLRLPRAVLSACRPSSKNIATCRVSRGRQTRARPPPPNARDGSRGCLFALSHPTQDHRSDCPRGRHPLPHGFSGGHRHVPHRASIAPVLRLPTRLRALPRRGWQRALAHVLHAQRRPRVSSPGGAPSVLLPRLRPLERRHRAHHVRRPPRAVVEGGHPRPAERARAPRRRVVLRRLLRPHPVDRRRPRSRGRVVLDRRSRTERAGVPSLLLLPPAVVRCRVRGGGVLPRRREARRVDAIGGGDGSGAGRHASRTSRATPRARGCLRGCRRGGYRCVRRGGFRRGGCLPERSARLPERRRGGRRARPASITPSTGRVPAHPDRGVDVSHRQSRVELVSPRRTRRRVSAVRAHGVRHVHARACERLCVRSHRRGPVARRRIPRGTRAMGARKRDRGCRARR